MQPRAGEELETDPMSSSTLKHIPCPESAQARACRSQRTSLTSMHQERSVEGEEGVSDLGCTNNSGHWISVASPGCIYTPMHLTALISGSGCTSPRGTVRDVRPGELPSRD